MDRLVEVCVEEVGLEGLDGITLETFWMRLATRDPPFSLALDEYSKPAIWQQLVQSDEVQFFVLPQPREMPILRDLKDSQQKSWCAANTMTQLTEKKMTTTVYPIAYIEDKEKGIRGSCSTYKERENVSKLVRDDEYNVQMSLAEAVSRWGAKLVMVANQDVRWKCMVGLYGDPQVELTEKQYLLLEAICRGRHLGEWQSRLSKQMNVEPRNIFYPRVQLSKGGFIKKRYAIYQVENRPQTRSVIIFGSSFKENCIQPMYETLWEGVSDLLETRPNRTWTLQALRSNIRQRFPDIKITDKTFKKVLNAARAVKIIDQMKLLHEEVFNEKKTVKYTNADTKVNGVKLLKTFEEYLNEENLEDEDEDEKQDGDPMENCQIAERNMKSQAFTVIKDKLEQGELMPHREVKHALMIDFYASRLVLKRLCEDGIVCKIMTDEGRQRTAVYCLANYTERAQQILNDKLASEKGISEIKSPSDIKTEDIPSTSSAIPGESEDVVTVIKQEFPDTPVTAKKDPTVRSQSEFTSNHSRRRQYILDFMHTNRVVEYVFPILKALRAEERKMGLKVTCDTKTIRRLVQRLCQENLLQTISTVVMSDDGHHSKTVTLITEYDIKPDDVEITSALQVARFRFFGSINSMKRKKGTKAPPKAPTKNAGSSKAKPAAEKAPKENKLPSPKKKKTDDTEKKHSHKKSKKAKHKHKDKKEVETISTDEDKPKKKTTPPYQGRKFYYRQLGYQPKMMRMRIAHEFMWHMVYGQFGLPLKRETLKDIEAIQLDEDTEKTEGPMEVDDGASLPPIPVGIRKAGDDQLNGTPASVIDTTEDKSQQEMDQTNQSEAGNGDVPEANSGVITPPDSQDDILTFDDNAQQSSQRGIHHMKFTVYSNTYDWRRYVPPFPVDPKRPPGWCVVRDLLLAMPVSIFLKIVSLPINVEGIKEYLNHPMKKHILMRHLPITIRRQLLRGRTYLFSIQNVLIKLAAIGLVWLTNMNNINKDQLSVFICKKASILDTTISKPGPNKIDDQLRYMRRFYQLDSLKGVEDYWFDLQCICLDTPLGLGRPTREKGKVQKTIPESRHENHMKTIAQVMTDIMQPVIDDGIPPGDCRGAGGLDSCFFSHLRRNWNWYNTVAEVHYHRYTARNPNDNNDIEDPQQRTVKSKTLKRLGSIKYKRNNMSKGTTVEVVSVTRKERKEMQATVSRHNSNKFEDQTTTSPPVKTKKQFAKEQTKETKDQFEEAKKKDKEIQNERRTFRTAWTEDGKRNTTTYDDKDEEARSLMSKMRVDWSPEEDSLILLCRVASTILNTKARRMGAFVPWYVIRDVMQTRIERSKDKTTKSVAKRSHHIMKNPSTFLNFRICLAEAYTDKELLQLVSNQTEDYSKTTVCAKEFDEFVTKLQEKFQNNDSTIGALRDIQELNKYIITPVHHQDKVDEKTLTKRDIKSVEDIHFKLLCSFVLGSLASRDTDLYNNQLVYKTYEQYDQDLLGSVFVYFRKLGFVNRYRKQAMKTTHKRIIPVAPISIQLSQSYKERFYTPIPEQCMAEMYEFMAKFHEADDSLVLPTEINGGDCASILSLMAADKVTMDIALPDQILKFDLNLVEGDLRGKTLEDSDSDSDEENESESSAKPTKRSIDDIQELIRIQKERTNVIEESSKKTVQETSKPSDEQPVVENVPTCPVFSDHSYSMCHTTLPPQDEAGVSAKDDGDSTTSSQMQRTTGQTDSSQSDPTGKGDNKTSGVTGYNIPGSAVSHSRWLVLQGTYGPGVCGTLGMNIQDNTLVNACTVTLLKADQQSMDSSKECTEQQHALLWDLLEDDDGKFKGFERRDNSVPQLIGRKTTCDVNAKWSDVDNTMITGLGLKWPEEDLHALRTVYSCINKAEEIGIIAMTEFQQQCAILLPNVLQKTIRDCLQILVQEQLVLELGFDVLRFVAAEHASPWLIHSTRLNRDELVFHQPKKQRMDPPLTDPPLIDITKDENEECVVISDDDDDDNAKDESPRSKETVTQPSASQPDQVATEEEEGAPVSGKRKRPPSPTECGGNQVTFVGRPWISIEGYQSDCVLMKYLQNVLLYITTKPGVKERIIFENFKDILHPVECMELLKMLKDIGCITRHRVPKMKPTSVFIRPMQKDTADKTFYYQPTVDCLARCAELGQPNQT